jgi:hypothetical protein
MRAEIKQLFLAVLLGQWGGNLVNKPVSIVPDEQTG